ncbi:hypothetical protein NCCP28_02730 [Niallia sp. NCCP-28]|nr:hypothetical protein NCCP28_02730 [Niallia sp. NCCP-28]
MFTACSTTLKALLSFNKCLEEQPITKTSLRLLAAKYLNWFFISFLTNHIFLSHINGTLPPTT